MAEKPWGITVTCLILAVTALVTIYSGALLTTETTETVEEAGNLMAYTPTTNMMENVMSVTGFALIALGIVLGLLAILLWRENEVAWYAAVMFLVIGVGIDAVAMAFGVFAVTGASLIAIALSIFMIFCLYHRDTLAAVKPELVEWKGWTLE